jgi:hypothetical protein
MDTIDSFKGKKTLIVGDINTGKTARTVKILQHGLSAGWGPFITVIDLAPDAMGGVGGKIKMPELEGLQYFTGPIVPPRLTATDTDQAQLLAQANARAIDRLFEQFNAHPSKILFVNDASLYLQAGAMTRFQAVMEKAETVVMNAYLGNSFPDSALTRREKRMILTLIQFCDHIINTSK